LLNDIISFLDITLNQIYLKAEYSPLKGWFFDREKLGVRHGRKLNDKLKWVYQITGKHLKIEKYMASLNQIRMIRNHFNHYDPPSIAFNLEEVNNWLNWILDVASIVHQIRLTLNEPTSPKLISLLLQRRSIFIPEEKFEHRFKQDENHGYFSSIFK